MRRLVFALLFLCAGILCAESPVQAAPNYQCIADCTAQGNLMSFCRSRCAYQNPSVIPRSQPMFKPLIATDHGMGYQCYAACKEQNIEDAYCASVCAK